MDVRGPYFVGRDKRTKWGKHCPPKNVRTRRENLTIHLPGAKDYVKGKTLTEIWECFFDREILDKIVNFTNVKIELENNNYSRSRDLRPTNIDEINALIGLLYLAGENQHQQEHVAALAKAGQDVCGQLQTPPDLPRSMPDLYYDIAGMNFTPLTRQPRRLSPSTSATCNNINYPQLTVTASKAHTPISSRILHTLLTAHQPTIPPTINISDTATQTSPLPIQSQRDANNIDASLTLMNCSPNPTSCPFNPYRRSPSSTKSMCEGQALLIEQVKMLLESRKGLSDAITFANACLSYCNGVSNMSNPPSHINDTITAKYQQIRDALVNIVSIINGLSVNENIPK
ncbi:Transposase IS4 [Popillia japonica]|uniref:Transposase IS4 n=1 Tax=Popillia japonica TaxID=7064 RepID=A0AAW1JG44_POPJA